MMYTSWHEAHAAAVVRARESGMDVAIRSSWLGPYGRSMGPRTYSVSLASRHDSDYDRAEIVRPGDR